MLLPRFPAEQLAELSTPITRAAWPDVEYYDEIMDTNLWHVANPTGQLGNRPAAHRPRARILRGPDKHLPPRLHPA